jgi:hypothetical protein
MLLIGTTDSIIIIIIMDIVIHNEELNDLYSSPHIVRVIKSRRIR